MKTSVVIIARNAENSLGNCIKSLMQQSALPSEIIVVDNGSTDSTAMIARRARVRVVSEPVRGRSNARNKGILAAKGDLVLFIDSDAYAHPDWLKYLVLAFGQGSYEGIAGNIRAANPSFCIPRLIDMTTRNRRHYGTGNIAYKKKALLEVEMFNKQLRIAEDVELAWRMIQAGYRIGFEPRAIVYHFHPTNLRRFLTQQYDFGTWSMIARKLLGMPTFRQRLLMAIAPLMILKHVWLISKHPLLPLFSAAASVAYAAGLSKGLSMWRSMT